MPLHSGKRINKHQWEEIPIDYKVIQHIENISQKKKQPLLPDVKSIFNGNWG